MKLTRSRDRTILGATGGILIGSLILVWGANTPAGWRATLLVNGGSFVIASVAMALIFEFWQLRSLLDDLYEHARITTQLRQAKLAGFSVAFHDGVAWEELFERTNHLRLMVAYGATWRNSQQTRLQTLLSKSGNTLEVALPNPHVRQVIDELAARFSMTPDELRGRVEEAIRFFQDLQGSAKGIVRIHLYDRPPHFTLYLFDDRAVFTTYRHRLGRGPILTILADRGGEMYSWLQEEWDGITGEGSRHAGLIAELTSKYVASPSNSSPAAQ